MYQTQPKQIPDLVKSAEVTTFRLKWSVSKIKRFLLFSLSLVYYNNKHYSIIDLNSLQT